MNKIILPALRGVMGDWVYYTCLMNLKEISSRVKFANEIHKNHNLSSMIQRQLQGPRSKSVAEYLNKQPERLFSSLVIATYGGSPQWSALSEVTSKRNLDYIADLDEDTVSSVGFLILDGNEELFALDGQHRLAGIKIAVEQEKIDSDPYDEVSVILVTHKKTAKGLERTRRLFTTLNKTARPVTKGDIIALDEDDVMALSTRWLIEETDILGGNRIAFVQSNNMPASNKSAITTIGNLYDLLTLLFTEANSTLKNKKPDLQRIRPKPDVLTEYFDFSLRFFKMMGKYFPEVGEFFNASDTSVVVEKYRHANGGSALFRPIGLEVFVKVIVQLTKEMTLEEAISLSSKLPRDLNREPFKNLMWSVSSKTMLNAHKVTLRELLLYMLNRKSKFSNKTLLERYRRETGDENIVLPEKVAE